MVVGGVVVVDVVERLGDVVVRGAEVVAGVVVVGTGSELVAGLDPASDAGVEAVSVSPDVSDVLASD